MAYSYKEFIMDRRSFLKGLSLTLGTGLIGAEIISNPKELKEIPLDSTVLQPTSPLTAQEVLSSKHLLIKDYDGDVLNPYNTSNKYLTPNMFPHRYTDMTLPNPYSKPVVEKRKRILSYKNPLLAPFIK